MRTITPSKLLRAALVGDAVASGSVALLQLTAATPVAEATALPRALVFESGVFLLAYTALLAAMALAPALWRDLVRLVVAGNVGWALLCVALPALGLLAPSALGVAFLGVHVVAVLASAALEAAGLRRSAPAAGTAWVH